MDGLRDGYGLLYCTDLDAYPQLFECEWSKGNPIQGRETKIVNGRWQMYEGAFGQVALPNGQGKLVNEDGSSYEGGFRKGSMHGTGRYTWEDGRKYEGEWKNNR